MGTFYQRFYMYNPVGNFEVSIGAAGAEINVSIQAVDLGGEAVNRKTVFTMIMCEDVEGTPVTAETYTVTENDGVVLSDISEGDTGDILICATDDEGLFDADIALTVMAPTNRYLLLIAPTGTYDIVGPLGFTA